MKRRLPDILYFVNYCFIPIRRATETVYASGSTVWEPRNLGIGVHRMYGDRVRVTVF
jgi:hypothetical protein